MTDNKIICTTNILELDKPDSYGTAYSKDEMCVTDDIVYASQYTGNIEMLYAFSDADFEKAKNLMLAGKK